MARLPLLGLLFLLFASQASAQPKMIRSAFNPTKTGATENIPVRHLANEKSDTTHYLPISTVKSEFTVNSGTELFGSDQDLINIVNGPDGTFLCAWIDYRSWDPFINAQLFDRDGLRIGPMIHVSDQAADEIPAAPCLLFNTASNEYVVVWQDQRGIRLQRLSAAGEKLGANVIAAFPYEATNIAATADSSGNIFITWRDFNWNGPSPAPDVQAVSKDGTPLAGHWSLAAADTAFENPSFREDNSIAADGNGHCLIVWNRRSIDGRASSQIVLQSVNQHGNLYQHPVVVSDSSDSHDQVNPTIASLKDGHFFILWNSNSTLYGRIFHPDSGFITPPIPIAGNIPTQNRYAMTSDDAGKFFVIWDNARSLLSQGISAQGTRDNNAVAIRLPSVFTITKGTFNRFRMGFGRSDHNERSVMYQAFDLSFFPIGSAQKVTDAPNSADQVYPEVRYNRYGQALTVWADTRNGYLDLYGQLFDAAGNPRSANFQISDTASHQNYHPSIATDPDGNFTVAFSTGDYNSSNVRLQKIFSNGMPSGGNIDAGGPYLFDYDYPVSYIQTDSVRNALVCWWLGRHAVLYSRRFDAALTPSGSARPIFNANASVPIKILSVSANHRFDMLVLWTDFIEYYDDFQMLKGGVLKAILIDEKGKVIRDTMLVGVVPDNKQLNSGTCRIDDEGNMLFVWTDRLVGPGDVTLHTLRIYPKEGVTRTDSSLSYYDYSGAQIAKFEKKQALITWDTYPHMRALLIDDASWQTTPIDLRTIPTPDYGDTRYHAFSTDCYDNLLFTAYQKPVVDRGIDILAKVQFFGRTGGSGNNEITENSIGVYPNPVRHSATFRYAFANPTDARISVYNILGQKVADIVQGMKPPGQYTMQFPTRDLPAGVYFFVLNGIKTSTTKFIVVK